MAKNEDKKRDFAEDYYIRLNMSGRDIASVLDVSEQTISRWKKGRKGEDSTWDERKAEIQLTPVKLQETLMKEANSIASGNAPKISADALSKVMKAIFQLDKVVNPMVVQSVFIAFDNFMAEVDPKTAVEFTKFHKLYLQHIIALKS